MNNNNNNIKVIIFALLYLFVNCEKITWPLGKCSRNDPQLDDCILKLAKKALPLIVNGNEKLEIPSLDPLRIGNYVMNVTNKTVNLRLGFENASLIGAGNMSISYAHFNKNIRRMDMIGEHRELHLKGNFSLGGNLFLVPINSKGNALFTFKNIQANHTILFTSKAVKGETYLNIKIIFKIMSIEFIKIKLMNPSFSSLANTAVNKLINNNWKLLFNSFTPSIENMVELIFTNAFKPMFSKFSYEELLPTRV